MNDLIDFLFQILKLIRLVKIVIIKAVDGQPFLSLNKIFL